MAGPFLRCPVNMQRLLGVDPDKVQDVILTHLHYHVGNFHRFPVAQFHLQDRELNHATGRSMRHSSSSHLTGGHTAGLQFVRVHTKRGWRCMTR